MYRLKISMTFIIFFTSFFMPPHLFINNIIIIIIFIIIMNFEFVFFFTYHCLALKELEATFMKSGGSTIIRANF